MSADRLRADPALLTCGAFPSSSCAAFLLAVTSCDQRIMVERAFFFPSLQRAAHLVSLWRLMSKGSSVLYNGSPGMVPLHSYLPVAVYPCAQACMETSKLATGAPDPVLGPCWQ